MKKITQMIYTGFLLTTATLPGIAAEPVIPPLLEPQEEWILTYASYKFHLTEDRGPTGLSRELSAVQDNDDLYFQGIFPEYPDAWIKCTVLDSGLQFENGQLLAIDGNNYVYFHCGQFDYSWSDGNTYVYEGIDFTPAGLQLTKSGEDGVYTAARSDWESGAFWYTDGTKGTLHFWQEKKWNFEQGMGDPVIRGTGFPNVNYMVHMTLCKKGQSGIQSVDSEDVTAPIYDLQGRQINPDNARSGIYIRNGKKIVIR